MALDQSAQEWPLARATPVLIGGVARSGTRMLADILNVCPTVAIQPETPPKAIELFLKFAGDIDGIYAGLGQQLGRAVDQNWRQNRAGLLHALFIAASRDRPSGVDRPVTHFGLKLPSLERYFSEFDRYYDAPKPYMIYCMRRPDAVWRSIRSFGWQTDFEKFLQSYRRSMSHALAALARSPDRLVVFNLNAFLEGDSVEYVAGLCARLGVPLEAEAQARIAQVDNRNGIAARGREYADTPELAGQMQALLDNDVIRERWLTLTGVELPSPAAAPAIARRRKIGTKARSGTKSGASALG